MFRFDGYWVLSDALGVTDLSRQPRRLVRRLIDRLRKRPTLPLPWSRWATAVLCLYTPLSFGLWAVFLWRLAPRLWAQARALPEQIAALAASPGAASGAQLADLLAAMFLLLVSGWMIAQTAARVSRGWRRS